MRAFIITLLLLLASGTAMADANVPTRDIAGVREPAWLKRYEGSVVVSHEYRAFDAVAFPASKLLPSDDKDERDAKNNIVFRAKETIKAEGAYTRVVYVAPADRSPLEVMRNYLDLIAEQGGKVRYQCEEAACGGGIHGNDHGGDQQGLLEQIYPQSRLKDEAFSNGACATSGDPGEQRYALATVPGADGGERTLGVYVYAIQPNTYCDALGGRTGIVVVAIEPKAREKKMVTVTSDAMAKALQADGAISLYGILFDTNKSTIKPDSSATIDQIAKLLTAQPRLSLDVVGHTDDVGGADANLKLSQRRADAVVKALVEDHGIDEARLTAKGAGMSRPIADNATEAGRAKNRRVELVKR